MTREENIKALRDLADWLEARPDIGATNGFVCHTCMFLDDEPNVKES